MTLWRWFRNAREGEQRRRLAAFMAVMLVAFGCSSAFAASKSAPVSVAVQHHPSITGDVTISFTPREPLPNGGYYYAVVVLTKHYAKRFSSERCAQASDMEYTEYGYPGPGKPVSLALSAEKSRSASGATTRLDWCRGAAYRGAVYAIPHGKPCRRLEPCYGHSTAPECYSGEPLCSNGKQLYGIVARPKPRQPGELPPPRDGSARIVAYFHIRFPNK
jgi:hypothetical protein